MPVSLDTNRINQIAAMLPKKPQSIGDPITKRDQWNKLRDHTVFSKIIPAAENLLKTKIPEKPESLMLDFKNTGNRSRWQSVDSNWNRRLDTLFMAECLENKGRFLPALEEIITAFCNEPTWVMPAHDSGQRCYYGKYKYADLKATSLGMQLGIIYSTLGDRLTPQLRKRIKAEVIRRNINPYKAQITGGTPLTWSWIICANNWNAVCTAGITGAALALIDDTHERALFIAAAEVYSKRFLSGFTADGYCSEGMGYWNYGYGHYILLTELIHQATDGKVDLLQLKGAKAAGYYAGIFEIQNGIYPAFADCSIGSNPSSLYMYYLSRRYGFGFTTWDNIDPTGGSTRMTTAMMYAFQNSANLCTPKIATGPRLKKRTWFKDAGVLICRPGADSKSKLAAAVKGGHNAEHHNHNDVGTYLVVSGCKTPLIDPGAEVYTRRTFSSQRYESGVLNSFGHPVPMVAGKLQSKGRQAHGAVIKESFSDMEDRLIIDIKSAYDVPQLQSLQRIFHYSRKGIGSFSVTDRVEFDSPQSFESALITLSDWVQQDANTLFFRELDEGVKVRIEAEGGDFEIEAVVIDEDVRTSRKPTRIAIRMKAPVKTAVIKIEVTPDCISEDGKTHRLFNGDFELKSLGWRLNDNMGALETNIVASGRSALRITDTSKRDGSNIISSRMDVTPGEQIVLTGRHYSLSGSGLGLYVKFYNKENKLINKTNRIGHISPVIVPAEKEQRCWESFSKSFTIPPETEYIRLWIHSMTSSVVDAVLDELELQKL